MITLALSCYTPCQNVFSKPPCLSVCDSGRGVVVIRTLDARLRKPGFVSA